LPVRRQQVPASRIYNQTDDMPIFEYVCRDCHHPFEAIVTASRQAECPACHSQALDKQLSVFAVSTTSSGRPQVASAPSACGSCGDPRGPGSCSLN
jgi:putative FmdB family regulatory protein